MFISLSQSQLISQKGAKDQNNWQEPEQKNKLGVGDGSGAKIKVGPKILGGPINPNDAMVVVLKDILLCLLGFRFIYIVYIS